MRENSENKRRVAKNTIILYFRMFFTMFINLYSGRVILQALGVEDYGIYNVVGGITTMFGFINSSMSVASSRFIAFAIGKGDKEYEKSVFYHIRYIHLIIGILIILLIETVGLWFLYEKLVIPPERLDSAFWVLQMSALFCFVSVISTPYNALIVAYERMASFAYITVLNSLLILGISFLVAFYSEDRLVFYAVLLACESILIRVIYMIYCRKNFPLVMGKVKLQIKLLKELAAFAGWNTLGNVALMSINQGSTFLLNIFFGPVVNAANGVAMQVTNWVSSFSSNIRMAINPQITKSYSQGNWEYMHELIRISSVYPFYLILICLIPLWLICDFLLHLWLVDVPEYAVPFVRLGLLYILVSSFGGPLIIGIHATGKIQKFQIVEGILMLLYFPLAYLLLSCGYSPNAVYIALILNAILTQIGRIYVIFPAIHISYTYYWHRIIFPCLKTSVVGFTILYMTSQFYGQHPFLAFFSCVVLMVLGIYYVGIEQNERALVLSFVRKKLHLSSK